MAKLHHAVGSVECRDLFGCGFNFRAVQSLNTQLSTLNQKLAGRDAGAPRSMHHHHLDLAGAVADVDGDAFVLPGEQHVGSVGAGFEIFDFQLPDAAR
jgi:hypothetical protein